MISSLLVDLIRYFRKCVSGEFLLQRRTPVDRNLFNFDPRAKKGDHQLFTHIRGGHNAAQLSRRESNCTIIVKMVAKPLVLVLGDSYVYWLERFVASTEVDFAPGSVCKGLDCRIAFKGYWGGMVANMEKNRGFGSFTGCSYPSWWF